MAKLSTKRCANDRDYIKSSEKRQNDTKIELKLIANQTKLKSFEQKMHKIRKKKKKKNSKMHKKKHKNSTKKQQKASKNSKKSRQT
jgi:hypothetical protein